MPIIQVKFNNISAYVIDLYFDSIIHENVVAFSFYGIYFVRLNSVFFFPFAHFGARCLCQLIGLSHFQAAMKFLLNKYFSYTIVFVLTSIQTFANLFLLLSGFWLLHCHIDFHLDLGMGLIVQVGEISEMKPKPKNFPTCGDWEFDVSIIHLNKSC